MDITNKQLAKIAEAIRDQLKELKKHHYDKVHSLTGNVILNLGQLQMIQKGMKKAIDRNWDRATSKLAAKAQRVIRDTPHMLSELKRAIDITQTSVPPARQIYEELKQIQQEFCKLEYYPEDEVISVFTEPIELEGIFLGEFEIRLQLPGLAKMQDGNYFRVAAFDPHPAACNYEVTHPHVSQEYLCEVMQVHLSRQH